MRVFLDINTYHNIVCYSGYGLLLLSIIVGCVHYSMVKSKKQYKKWLTMGLLLVNIGFLVVGGVIVFHERIQYVERVRDQAIVLLSDDYDSVERFNDGFLIVKDDEGFLCSSPALFPSKRNTLKRVRVVIQCSAIKEV